MAVPDWIGMFIEPLDRLGLTFMVTGSVGAMQYGEPRLTMDVDVVLDLPPDRIEALLACFPDTAFYAPPAEVLHREASRDARGHFNIIHHATGMKADFYLAGRDPLQRAALRRRRRLEFGDGPGIALAPPEYIIVRKLEFHREGQSSKHLRDVAAMIASGCDLDLGWLEAELAERGLMETWRRIRTEDAGV